MKTSYPLYRGNTSLLEQNLNSNEKKVLDEYLKFLSGSANPSKVQQNKRFLLQFRDLIEKPLTQVKRKDLEAFWGLVKTSPHEYNTKVMIKRGVKRFCKYYYKDLALVEGLEVGDFKPNRKKINKTVLLTADEIKSICHTADTLRDKAIIVLLYESGARPQELLDLKWKDINFDTKEVHLDSSKTERARDLPIEESLIHLKRWRQEWAFSDVRDNDFVFPSRYRDKRLTTEYLNTIIKTWANKSGIKKEITAYTFRHSRLTEIYKLGVKGLEHNKFSGHKEGSKQQATYSHLDNEDMKDEVLRKVYHIEEVTEEQKNKYDLEIAELKNTIKDILKFNNTQNKELLELKEQLDANNSLLEAHTKEIIAKVRSKH